MREVVIDTETTGLSHKNGDRIIEVGCVELINHVATNNFLQFYCKVDKKISESAQKITGITNGFLSNKKTFGNHCDEFLNFINNDPLIIHNADFDVGFLDAEFKIASSTYPSISEICEVKDTLTIARDKFPGQRNSLDALSRRFDINGYDRSFHGALLDANILADVYSNLTGGQSKINFVNNFETESKEEDKQESKNLSNDFEITKVVTSEDDLILHSDRLQEIEKKIGKKAIWNS